MRVLWTGMGRGRIQSGRRNHGPLITLLLIALFGGAASAHAADPLTARAGEHELVTKATGTSKTFVSADGTRRVVLGPEPFQFKDGGSWKTIDTNLLASAGSFKPATSSFGLSVPSKLDSGHPVTIADGGATLSFSVVGASGDGKASGPTVSYPAALDAGSVAFTATSSGVRDAVTFAAAKDVKDVEYALKWTGVVPEHRDGQLVFTSGGKVRFAINDSFLTDSAARPHLSSRLKYDFDKANGHGTLTVHPDKAYLARKSTKGAVTLDPSVTVGGVSNECTISETLQSYGTSPGATATSTTDSGLCGSMTIGTSQTTREYDGRDADCGAVLDTYQINRALLRFDLSGIDPNSEISNAVLTVHGAPVTANIAGANWNSSATWGDPTGSSSWTGGDPTQLGNSYTDGTVTRNNVTWRQQAGGANAIQSMLTSTNVGFVLQGDEQASADPLDCPGVPNDVPSFDTTASLSTSTDSTPANRPVLQLTIAPRVGERPYFSKDTTQLTNRASVQVNLSSGNLLVAQTDGQQTGGLGPSVGLGHTYNSLGEDTGALGAGWSFDGAPDVHMQTFPGTDNVVLHGAGGLLVPIGHGAGTGDSQFTEPAWLHAQLTLTSGVYTLTDDASQGKQHFDQSTGRLTSIEDLNGRQVQLAYSSGQLDTIQDAAGRYLRATDTSGKLTSIAQLTNPKSAPGGGNPVFRQWQYAYDSSGRLHVYTDPESGTWTYDYDSSSRLNAITDPRGKITRITYDSAGKVHTVMRQTSTSGTPSGPTRTYTYSSGQTVVDDPNGHDSTFMYGPAGDDKGAIDARGIHHDHGFNTDLLVNHYFASGTDSSLSGSSPSQAIYYDTSNNANKIESTPVASGTAFKSYANYGTSSGVGSLVHGAAYKMGCSYDVQGNLVKYGYNTDGNQTSVTSWSAGTPGSSCSTGGTSGATSSSSYGFAADGKNGRLDSTTDANNNTTTYGYDSDGNLTSVTPPAGTVGTTGISYDSFGRVATVQNGRLETTTYTYDKLDRVTNVAYSDSSSVATTYDADDNVTQRVDPVGTTTYVYDALGRITQENEPGSRTTDYTYDPAGNLATLTDGGGTLTYSYANDNQIDRLRQPGDTTSQGTTFTYDTLTGAPDKETLPNSIVIDTDFDQLGRQTHLTADQDGTGPTAPFINTSYSYTGDKLISAGSASFSYDIFGRLANFPNDYDDVGNTTTLASSAAATFDGFNRMLDVDLGGSSGRSTMSYDDNGNTTSIDDSPSYGPAVPAATFSYNVRDQTTAISGATMSYLGAGQDELIADGSVTLQYNVLGLSRRTASSSSVYFTRTDTGQPIGQRTPSGRQYYVTDRLGSVVALTDASGSILDSPQYDDWGNLTYPHTLGSGSSTSYLGWEGGYPVTANGNVGSGSLYHFGARYYNPSIERWTQPDPAGQGLNGYDFASDDPINATDPSGLGAPGPNPTCDRGFKQDAGKGLPKCSGHNEGHFVRDLFEREGTGLKILYEYVRDNISEEEAKTIGSAICEALSEIRGDDFNPYCSEGERFNDHYQHPFGPGGP